MKRNQSKNRKHNLLSLVRWFCLIAFMMTASTWPAAAQTQTIASKPATAEPARNESRLSPEAAQVAEEVGVAQLLGQLSRKRADSSPINVETLAVRQEISERVLAASLDIDTVNAVIDSEVDQIRSIRADLQAKRDKAQNIINIASVLTGGVAGAVTSAMQFKQSTVNLGNGIGVGGGAGSVILSIVGMHMRGRRRTLGDSPRMLARFFGREPAAAEAIPSDYPQTVWSYLNSARLSEPNAATRREQLIAKWRSEGRIAQDTSPKSERKLESISSNLAQVRKLSISDMDDRVAMLLDVRATVSIMKRGLSEIVRTLSSSPSGLR